MSVRSSVCLSVTHVNYAQTVHYIEICVAPYHRTMHLVFVRPKFAIVNLGVHQNECVTEAHTLCLSTPQIYQ